MTNKATNDSIKETPIDFSYGRMVFTESLTPSILHENELNSISKENYRSRKILECIPDTIFIARKDGVIEEIVTPGSDVIYNQQIVGQNLDRRHETRDLLLIRETVSKILQDGISRSIEYMIFDDDKNKYYYQAKAIAFDEQRVMVFAHNITQRFVRQKRVDELNKLLNTILDTIPMELSIKDPSDEFRYLYWNKELERDTGIPAIQAIGKSNEEIGLFSNSLREEIRLQEEELLRTGVSLTLKTHRIMPSGKKKYQDLMKFLVPQGDNHFLIVSLWWDITSLIEAKESAEKADKMKSAFLANMSHEIRTPLNAIIGFSTLIGSTQDDEEKQQYLSIVQENNNQLLQIIEDILDLSKIEAGLMDYNIKEVDLFYLFKDLEKSACLRNTNDSVIISFEKDLSPKLIMETDKNRIAQVVNNLINNALKFTVQGSIVFGYRKEKEQVYFYVKDTGCGIPKCKLNLVFGRFVKLNNFVKGTGLGLSICESIVSHLGGTIGVDSKEGVGSNFWFCLPLSY